MDKQTLLRMIDDMQHGFNPNSPLLAQETYQFLEELKNAAQQL